MQQTNKTNSNMIPSDTNSDEIHLRSKSFPNDSFFKYISRYFERNEDF